MGARDANLAELEFLQLVAGQLHNAGHGEKGPIVSAATTRLQCSPQTLYAKLRQVGFHSRRRIRADRGDSRITEEQARAVAALVLATRRANGKVLMGVGDAIDVALANGILSERVSPVTMQRVMRLHNCHPAQLSRPSPHTQLRSLHPNHVWQLDASICVLYYLRDGRVRVLDERTFNARKPRELVKVLNQRVLRYAITDHFSDCYFARYYLTAGEDQLTLFDFLMAAFQERPEGYMHGVPKMLVWDAGSANQAHGIGNLLTNLAVRHWAHIPGNPRAKGQVERAHDVIERKFESRLSFVAVPDIDELNARFTEWLGAFNGSATHSRHGHTRAGLWTTARTEQIRICPSVELCQHLMIAKPVERTVKGNLTISFKRPDADAATYSVAGLPDVRVGDKVLVAVNPYRSPNIFIVGQDQEGGTLYHECEPLELDAAGFFTCSPVIGEQFRAPQDTATDTARKDVNQRAYGEADTLDATAAKVKGRLAFDGKIDPFADVRERAAQVPDFIRRRGTELHVPNPVQVEVKPLDLLAACRELRARVGRPITVDENAWLASTYPNGVPEDVIPSIAEQLQHGAAPTRPTLRVVGA